jgi:hypothetical protein
LLEVSAELGFRERQRPCGPRDGTSRSVASVDKRHFGGAGCCWLERLRTSALTVSRPRRIAPQAAD